MATEMLTKKITIKNASPKKASRALTAQVEPLVQVTYAFMNSPIFAERNIEKQLFTFEADQEPALPRTAWYQPTREEVESGTHGAPQLMSTAEERLMFLRFNFAKLKLGKIQARIQKEGLLTKESAEL